jgi:hypothetical protein
LRKPKEKEKGKTRNHPSITKYRHTSVTTPAGDFQNGGNKKTKEVTTAKADRRSGLVRLLGR